MMIKPWSKNTKDIFSLLVAILVAYVFGVISRLHELPQWVDSGFLNEINIRLPCNDAYGWMAGSQCVGHLTDQPLSILLRMVHQFTDFQLDRIAFWSPVILAPMVAIPLALLCVEIGIAEAGIGLASVVVLTPAYLFRSRLGYYDSDLLSLLVFCFVLFIFSILLRQENEVPIFCRKVKSLIIGSVLLLVCYFVVSWTYKAGIPVFFACLMTFVAALDVINSRSSCFIIQSKIIHSLFRLRWFIFMALFFYGFLYLYDGWSKLYFFLKSSNFKNISDISPSQSVLEVSSLGYEEISNQAYFNCVLLPLVLVGYCYSLKRCPQLLPSIPLAAMSLFSYLLGIRFSMYGGILVGIGLCFPVALLGRRLEIAWVGRLTMQLVLVFLFFSATLYRLEGLIPYPIVSKKFAEVVSRIRHISSADSQVWTWWDYGYAVQYYSHRRTFSDPGNNRGQVLYYLAQALASDDIAVSAGAIKYCSLLQYKNDQQIDSNFFCPGSAQLPNSLPLLSEQDDSVVSNLPGALASFGLLKSKNLPEQYIVVSWELLKIGAWLTYYADWKSGDNKVTQKNWPLLLSTPQRLNVDSGWIEVDSNKYKLSGLDIFDNSKGKIHREWIFSGELSAVLNLENSEIILFDKDSRNRTYVKLLLDNYHNFTDYFELVIDCSPSVRVYRIVK